MKRAFLFFLPILLTFGSCTNKCKDVNCLNDGACNDGTCVCPDGFAGEFCENNADPCADVNCLNGGTCVDGTCNCPPGFTGQNCATTVDPCENVNCLNGGTCVDGTCNCPPGFTGQNCATTVDLCESVDCGNNGTCVTGDCICETGYNGTNCQTVVRAAFIGSYNMNETCDVGTDTYAITIVAGTAITDVIITNLYDAGINVNGTVNSSGGITIPNQTFGSGTISGTATLNNDVLTISFLIEITGASDDCIAVSV